MKYNAATETTTATETTAATETTTATETTAAEEQGLRTVIAVEADSSEQITMMQAINRINTATDSMDKNHLEIVRNILDNLINDSDTEENVLYNILIVLRKCGIRRIDLYGKLKMNHLTKLTELAESVEYKVLSR